MQDASKVVRLLEALRTQPTPSCWERAWRSVVDFSNGRFGRFIIGPYAIMIWGIIQPIISTASPFFLAITIPILVIGCVAQGHISRHDRKTHFALVSSHISHLLEKAASSITKSQTFRYTLLVPSKSGGQWQLTPILRNSPNTLDGARPLPFDPTKGVSGYWGVGGQAFAREVRIERSSAADPNSEEYQKEMFAPPGFVTEGANGVQRNPSYILGIPFDSDCLGVLVADSLDSCCLLMENSRSPELLKKSKAKKDKEALLAHRQRMDTIEMLAHLVAPLVKELYRLAETGPVHPHGISNP